VRVSDRRTRPQIVAINGKEPARVDLRTPIGD